jgi:hypothetical protein
VHYRLRDETGALMEQGFRYGGAHARMARRLRRARIRPREGSGSLRRWLWLARKLHHLVLPKQRPRWLWTLSVAAGRLTGGLRTAAERRPFSTVITRDLGRA